MTKERIEADALKYFPDDDICSSIAWEQKVSQKAFIVGAMHALRYTSVNDSLPDVGEKVLVRTRNGNVSICEMYIPKDCHGNILGKKEWKGSYSFKESIIEWRRI